MTHKQVLIVDDNETTRFLLEYNIKTLMPGCQTILAKDGFAALAQLREHPFDLLITDDNMPGMTGLDLIQAACQIAPEMRIVLLTAQNTIAMQAEAQRRRLHFDGYLNKPFAFAQMSEVIRLVEL